MLSEIAWMMAYVRFILKYAFIEVISLTKYTEKNNSLNK